MRKTKRKNSKGVIYVKVKKQEIKLDEREERAEENPEQAEIWYYTR